MSYPPDILNPESLAEVLIESCTTSVNLDSLGLTNILRLNTLVELLVMYVPLDQYEVMLNEWAAQPEGKELPAAVKAVVDSCGHCEELRVIGPDHRNTRDASHDEGCVNGGLGGAIFQRGFAAAIEAAFKRVADIDPMIAERIRDVRPPCPKCGGCGSVSVPGELHDVTCPKCRGTGSEDVR